MHLIFCGTPQFAVPTLEKLVEENFNVQLVMTNPDEPSGRGYELKSPPVKQTALRLGLPLFQPAKIKEAAAQEFLTRLRPDAIVVVAYGHIIPQWMIDLPRLGCINLHASLLPKYRGAAPISWAIIRGESVTGNTTMQIGAGLDTGDLLLQSKEPVRDEDTTETLYARLSESGAGLIVETLRGLENGSIARRPQDPAQATLAPILRKEDGLLDWTLTAREVWYRVRGLRPWPGAFTTFRGKQLHIWMAALPAAPFAGNQPPGTLIVDRPRLLVVCGGKAWLELTEVQMEGRRRIPARDFLNGVRFTPGERLGK
jgi:methionyl-tRNA formyltransferase